MNLKKIVTLGITAAIAASTIAVTALTTNAAKYDKPYKSGYSYAYTGDSYNRMDYYENGTFIMTKATNKKSTVLYSILYSVVKDSKGNRVDRSFGDRTLQKKGSDASIGVIGCYNYRSTTGNNYLHRIEVFTDPNHSSKVTTIKKTVG